MAIWCHPVGRRTHLSGVFLPDFPRTCRVALVTLPTCPCLAARALSLQSHDVRERTVSRSFLELHGFPFKPELTQVRLPKTNTENKDICIIFKGKRHAETCYLKAKGKKSLDFLKFFERISFERKALLTFTDMLVKQYLL